MLQGKSALPLGFSLFEVMVVLTITMIIAGGTILAISTFHRRNILKSETFAVQLFLEEIYARALAYQSDISLSLAPTRIATNQALGSQRRSYSLRHGVILVISPTQSKTLQFTSSISTTPATIKLQYHGLTCDVVISLRGRIRTTC
jgi:type II secretory pathway pseudopilin PulG